VKLLGVEFGTCFVGSGTLGFFGEGYWFHKLLRPFGLNFDEATFVSKTVTRFPREGNMNLWEDGHPKEWIPSCIKVDRRQQFALNAVGLANHGILWALRSGKWQKRTKPFVISIAAVDSACEDRVEQMRSMAKFINNETFLTRPAIELNVSCPNVPHGGTSDWEEWLRVVFEYLEVVRSHLPFFPIIVKHNILVPQAVSQALTEQPFCNAIHVGNTIPWGAHVPPIQWRDFGTLDLLRESWDSPLACFGGGGLSGAPLKTPVLAYLSAYRKGWEPKKPIIAGGGILSETDVLEYFNYGADAVALASIAFLSPTRVKKVVAVANKRRVDKPHSERLSPDSVEDDNPALRLAISEMWNNDTGPLIGEIDEQGNIWIRSLEEKNE
jgi:dihydroorotate dehydrogenase